MSLKKYKKNIKKNVFNILNEISKESDFYFIKFFFLKRKIFYIFKNDKNLNYLLIYFQMFCKEIKENNKKNIEKISKFFIIYYFSIFILPKFKKNSNLKKIFLLIKDKWMLQIENFFKQKNIKIKFEIPVFKSKTYIDLKQYSTNKILIYANFFKLFVKLIKGIENTKENLENSYKLGFSLAMCTFSSIERKKYNNKFLRYFNYKNKKKTDLFFLKLFSWTNTVEILRILQPYKYNIFIIMLNKQIGS